MALLDLKLRRDLLGLKSQALAVALVMACGLSMMIMTRSLILTLETTRDEYYRNYRFADVFAQLKRIFSNSGEVTLLVTFFCACWSAISCCCSLVSFIFDDLLMKYIINFFFTAIINILC